MKFENQKKLDVVEARVTAILKEVTDKKGTLDEKGITEVNTLLTELIEIANNEIKSNV